MRGPDRDAPPPFRRGGPRGWPPHGPPPGPPPWAREWHARRRGIFLRAFVVLGVMALLVAAGMAVLAALLVGVFGPTGETRSFVWLGGCALSLVLPIVAALLFRGALSRIALPLTDIVATLDTVAAGDLSVRVPERGRGEMARLGAAFNRMVVELERTEQQRRNLTADVAHELRTPLHIIQGNLEGILDGVYQPTREHLEATLEETRLLARLVEDLRTLSLAEAGELPLRLELVDLSELLADAVTSFSGAAEGGGITLTLLPTTAPLLVQGDADRLDQVVGNLLSNALRHTPRGGTVTLALAHTGDTARMTVQDTGEGIPADALPFIFDRFWRGDRARTHGESSGLGLSIANHLTRAHGGTLSATSQPGAGTTFVVELPLAV